MESFSWVSEGPSPLKETQTVKKNIFEDDQVPGHHPRALIAQIDQGDRTEAKPSLVFPTAMVVKVKDAETKRNKASVAHTGWNKRKKTSTTTPKKVCLYSSSLHLVLFEQKICKSQRAIVQQEKQIHGVTGLVV